MKIDFSKLLFEDMDGNQVQDADKHFVIAHKSVANVLYQDVTTLDLVDVARQINAGEVIDVRPGELAEITRVLMASSLAAFAKQAVDKLIRAAQEQENNDDR